MGLVHCSLAMYDCYNLCLTFKTLEKVFVTMETACGLVKRHKLHWKDLSFVGQSPFNVKYVIDEGRKEPTELKIRYFLYSH